mmetsp:Transcript_31575/g.66140  ORF Transcript_31575/g.66140 Transcript_31575/m.66140 type:complete len:89 (-) Transcript_31575:1152-1418(-)
MDSFIFVLRARVCPCFLSLSLSDGGSLLFYANSILTDAPSDEIKAGTERGPGGVSVYASISSFVRPPEEAPYLRIPPVRDVLDLSRAQ